MSFDDKVKKELMKEAEQVDQILADDQGLFDMLLLSFKGGMRRWVILMNLITLFVAILMFWSGYRFYIAVEINNQIFWGICTLVAINMQVALKQWLWMEMNRSSLMREIKRVELAINRISG